MHDKTNKTTCTPSEDSDQPGHPPSLIRVFAVRIKKHWVLSYPMSAQRRLWPDWGMSRLIRVFAWRKGHFIWFCCAASHIEYFLEASKRPRAMHQNPVLLTNRPNMRHVMRKAIYAKCDQQRHRSACASAQSDQCICRSLPGKYNSFSCYNRNFTTVGSP